MTSNASPRITVHGWGHFTVDGLVRPVKHAKLWPGGARSWDWTETGTHHQPGVQVADVQELMDHGARTVVLPTGRWNRLRVADAMRAWLTDQGIGCHVIETPAAVEEFNAMRDRELVGALVHSTC